MRRHFPQLLLRFFLVDLALNFFDERQNIAHSEDSLGDAIGIKRLDRVVFFADADKLYRLADNLFDRQSRTAACVAVHLGQDNAGDADTLVKNFCRTNRVLPGHRVGDKQNFDRLGLGLDLLELDHQLVVDVQTAGRVDHQRVKAHLVRVLHQHRERCVIGSLVSFVLVNRNVDRICDNLKLFASRRTINVNRNEQRLSFLIVGEPTRDLSGRGRFTRTLQTDDHHDVRRSAW